MIQIPDRRKVGFFIVEFFVWIIGKGRIENMGCLVILLLKRVLCY